MYGPFDGERILKYMKMTFRWYGKDDPVTLSQIRQIPGMTGVVTALYDVPVGEVWPENSIFALKKACEDASLKMQVIESVPVHEDIRLGRPGRDRLIANYAETIRRLGRAGVKCVCYNFMPVFDWVRTDLHREAADGSRSLAYEHAALSSADPTALHLPGWDESYEKSQLRTLLEAYRHIDHDTLFDHLVYFLRGIMPACNEAGVDMAIHPDDPPWDLFGLPRIITGREGLKRLFDAVPDPHNGLTFCTGSLGASPENDLVSLASEFAPRIKFAHLRQIRRQGERDFYECGHMTDMGSLDMYGIVLALCRSGFDGYVRPDHGRDIWGEHGRPGYGLYDRALGAMYLSGLFEGVKKSLCPSSRQKTGCSTASLGF